MAEHEQQIAVDKDAEFWDDGSTESMWSANSAANSIFEYRFENGRRYHAYRDGAYAFPNDEKEQVRLDLIHHICLLVLEGNLHIAPLCKTPEKILDIGTGTGIWAIDMGELYPSAEVIGTDLSPIQPSWVPPNVHFQIDDAESEWEWEKGSFDMVHIRHLNGAISDWATLYAEAYKSLKPGGWIEICEHQMNMYSDDGTYSENSYMHKYYQLTNEAARISGRPFIDAAIIPGFLENAGFKEVTVKMVKIPMGTWPADLLQREVGESLLLVSRTGFEALGIALLTRHSGMDLDDVKKILSEAEREASSKKIHSYNKFYFMCAQKPIV